MLCSLSDRTPFSLPPSGTSANAHHFQALLLDGLVRWNENCAAAAVEGREQPLLSYSGHLQHSLNQLSQRVLGVSLVKDHTAPRECTGVSFGLSQSVLQFGKYKGISFRWLLGNDLGYVVMLLAGHQRERETGNVSQVPLMENKDALDQYAQLFPRVVAAARDWRGLDRHPGPAADGQ